MPYLFTAFCAIWIVLFLYLFSLSRRHRALAREVEALRQLMGQRVADPLTSQGKGPEPNQLRAAQFVDKQKLQPLVAKAFAKMGIQGEPIGAEKVQELIAACGVKPEDNVFSRGIIQMREE